MTKQQVVTILFSIAIYLALTGGIYLIAGASIQVAVNRWRQRRILIAKQREHQREKGAWRWLQDAIVTTTGRGISPNTFLIFSVGLFFAILLLGWRSFSPGTAVLTAGMAALLPGMLMWIRLSTIRRTGSQEGERLISEILRQYRLANCNIYDGLERVIKQKVDIRVTKRLLYRLLLELRETGNEKKIKKATETFAYGIQTNWGLMLAHNIETAAIRGIDVSHAVEDILIQLREARTIAEDRKRLNSEATRMTYFMVPLVYVTTVLMSIRYLDLTLIHFVHNQFYTPEGLLFFLIIAFLFVANISLLSLIANQRFDF